MSLIIFLLSSGALGLYTYLGLSRVAILGNETEETRKLYLYFFSFVTMILFVIVFSYFNSEYNLNDLFKDVNIFSLIISIFYTFLLVLLLNNRVYPYLIKNFRETTNNERISIGKSKIVDGSLIDTILDENNYINYIEIYKAENENNLLEKGLLKNYETDSENNINFLLTPASLRIDRPGVKKRIDSEHIYYSGKSNIMIKIVKIKSN